MKANKCLVMKFKVGDNYDPKETELRVRKTFGIESDTPPAGNEDNNFSWLMTFPDDRVITHTLYDNDVKKAIFVLRQSLPDNVTCDPDLLDSLLAKTSVNIQSCMPETASLRCVEFSYARTWDKGIEKPAKDIPADLMPEEYSRDTTYATREKPFGKIIPSYSEMVMKDYTEHTASVLALMNDGARTDLGVLIRDADLLCKDLMALNDE